MRQHLKQLSDFHSAKHCTYFFNLPLKKHYKSLTPPQHRPLSRDSMFPWRGSCSPCWTNLGASLFRTTRSEFRSRTATLYICYSHIKNPCYVGWLLVPDTEPQTAFLMRRLPVGLHCVYAHVGECVCFAPTLKSPDYCVMPLGDDFRYSTWGQVFTQQSQSGGTKSDTPCVRCSTIYSSLELHSMSWGSCLTSLWVNVLPL